MSVSTPDPTPVDGSAVRITISVDGVDVLDTDLTRMYLRSRYGGDVVMPFYFVPFTPPAEGEPDDARPTEPVVAMLRLTPQLYPYRHEFREPAPLPSPWDFFTKVAMGR